MAFFTILHKMPSASLCFASCFLLAGHSHSTFSTAPSILDAQFDHAPARNNFFHQSESSSTSSNSTFRGEAIYQTVSDDSNLKSIDDYDSTLPIVDLESSHSFNDVVGASAFPPKRFSWMNTSSWTVHNFMSSGMTIYGTCLLYFYCFHSWSVIFEFFLFFWI